MTGWMSVAIGYAVALSVWVGLVWIARRRRP